ncbi:putative vacuolar sorting protein SNF7 family protein [Talaromyces proteolyticus]|uniref:Vacuolar sorting protein SNF7 family protein n=1 Tax=Talaromyces proteolyticus TaxID=1131652 RepID=A0AAD4KQJ7_9EURO|nr:putative vacuolar sorting protein SNF7 family protein [Talaromyces proteolyticus]KAH8696708.1 putative vacuolar sorting protein SNF7 family protein [Talaromyces proteolyticus]
MGELVDYIISHEDAFRKNRLPSLYSDFSIQKNTNPDGYAVNVAAWESALTKAALAGYVASNSASGQKRDHLSLSADENLLRDLEIPEWGRPVALGSVFDEAVQKRRMIPLELYKSSAFSLKTSRWRVVDPGILSPWNVMNWSLRQLKGLVVGTEGTGATLDVQRLVLVENLEEAAKRIINTATGIDISPLNRIYSKEMFVKRFATVLDQGTALSDNDFDILLLHLSRDIKAAAYDGKTIKFHSGGDSSPIAHEDSTIASIKTLISNLTEQALKLEQKINELNLTAKVSLNNKNRISALSALKSRKIAEHNLKQRSDTLNQLEEVYNKIEQAVGQVEIVRVMEASTGVLRSLHAQTGGIETVEKVVENLREEMSKVDEIGNAIDEAAPVIDEGEIDAELEALEKQEQREKEDEEEKNTREKLAELDSQKHAAQEVARKLAELQKNTESADDSLLAVSIGKLSNMSLDEAEMERKKQVEEEPTPAQ